MLDMGKQTLEQMYGVEGSGVFNPILLAEYMDGQHEVTLLVGDLDNEALADALILVAKKGPLRSLTLTADGHVKDTSAPYPDVLMDALIVLNVGEDGQPRTVVTPYIIERTARRAIIVWDDPAYPSSDPRLAGALQIALSVSRATMHG